MNLYRINLRLEFIGLIHIPGLPDLFQDMYRFALT
jgi:hypothetical protein